jgi:DNA-binding beta-propeller fold protein YncE
MMRQARGIAAAMGLCALALAAETARAQSFVNFESGHVRPLALSPDGTKLFAVNTPDNRLEIYTVGVGSLTLAAEVPVGLEPIAVAARTNLAGRTEAWVVNHLSDSVSIVEVDPTTIALSHVTRTLATCDEPRDVVFAGAGNNRAFVTTARRGQNCPVAANLTTQGQGRAVVQVWNVNALTNALSGGPIANIVLFTDTPRALAKSPGSDTVYAAGFQSGNQTTSILEPTVTGSGNTRPPFPPGSTGNAPNTGLIVKFNPVNGRWEDERGAAGPNWDPQIPFNLPDRDVFLIDALAATPALFASANNVVRVGTVIFNMAVRPDNGRVYVANTDARNQVRFEPFISATQGVQGHIVESRITVISGTTPTPHHLNPHINYLCEPPFVSPCAYSPTEVEQSLAFPGDMVFSSDGQRVYVTGFGSQKIGIFDTDDLEANIITKTLVGVGDGPSGIVLDEARNQLYVMNRIDHTVSIVSNAATPATAAETAVVPLRYDPSPALAKDGRTFLYDARTTSSHGDQACASCHVFGDFDSLAWDLGNPFGAVENNPNPFSVPPGGQPIFHPLKGPMTTQSLRGMQDAGPMHWRGDRTGAPPANEAFNEDANFKKFNPAFVGLLGRPQQLDAPSMQAFTDFILTVQYPPNPIRALDDAPTTQQSDGETFFINNQTDASLLQCVFCHHVPMGTSAQSTIEGETQEFKIAHMRNLYQKIGMFGSSGDQVRGFGFLHDGSVFTVFNFLQAGVFNFGSPSTVANTNRRNVEAFALAFDTGLKPIVGQQVSLTPATTADATVTGRIDLLTARADAGNCDVVVKGNAAGIARGWRYVGGGNFQPDRNADAVITTSALRALAAVTGQEQTYTSVPPGSGVRIGLDRDEDGIFDRRELDCGTDPANPASFPSASGGCAPTTTTTSTSTSSSTSLHPTTTSTAAPTTSSSSTVVPTTSTSTSTTLVPPLTNVQSTSLKLRDPGATTSRRITFKSTTKLDPGANRVVVAGSGTAGDPTSAGSTGGGAVVTVYNSAGSGETVTVSLPAVGWTLTSKGYRFRAPATTDPIQRVTVVNDSVRLRGGKTSWTYTLDETAQGSVALRLRLGTGTTWCTDSPAKSPASSNDVPGKFVGQVKTPAPAVCPATP